MPSRRNIKEFLLYLLRSAVANLIHLLQVVGNPGFLFAFEARVNTRFSWFNKGKPQEKKMIVLNPCIISVTESSVEFQARSFVELGSENCLKS